MVSPVPQQGYSMHMQNPGCDTLVTPWGWGLGCPERSAWAELSQCHSRAPRQGCSEHWQGAQAGTLLCHSAGAGLDIPVPQQDT